MLLLSPATLLERRPLIYFCPLRLIRFFFSLSQANFDYACGSRSNSFSCACVRATTKDIITDVAEPKQNQ